MKKVFVIIGLIWPFLIFAQINKVFEKGDYLKVKELINKSPSEINNTDKNGNTPLHIAATNGYYEICELLIEKEADIEAVNSFDFTPLCNAINYKNVEIAEFLINSIADFKSENNRSKEALIFAVSHKLYDIVDLLLKKGADISATGHGYINNQAIHVCENVAIADLLIRNGADINARNNYGKTPLHQLAGAYASEQYSMIRYLVKQGANINMRNNNDFTPLDETGFPVNNTYFFRELGGLYKSELDTLLINFTPNFQILEKYESSANDVLEFIGPPHIVVAVEALGLEIWKYWQDDDMYELYISSTGNRQSTIDLTKPAEKIKYTGSNIGKLTAMYKNKKTIEFSPPLKLSDINGKVTSLLFYEGGYNILPKNQRKYAEIFNKSETRYIYWELNLEHPEPGKKANFIITYIYYKPDGTEFCRSKKLSYINKNWSSSWKTQGWGNKTPGAAYSKGIYSVKLYIADEEIASGKFEIY
jgi:hypothetical protein